MYRPAVPVTLRRAISSETTVATIDLLLFSNSITGASYWTQTNSSRLLKSLKGSARNGKNDCLFAKTTEIKRATPMYKTNDDYLEKKILNC